MYGQNEATGTLDHSRTGNSGVPFRLPAAGESAPSSLHLAALWDPLCASLADGILALATWGAPREKEGKHAGRRGGAYTSRPLGRFLPHLGNSRVTAPRPPLCYEKADGQAERCVGHGRGDDEHEAREHHTQEIAHEEGKDADVPVPEVAGPSNMNPSVFC